MKEKKPFVPESIQSPIMLTFEDVIDVIGLTYGGMNAVRVYAHMTKCFEKGINIKIILNKSFLTCPATSPPHAIQPDKLCLIGLMRVDDGSRAIVYGVCTEHIPPDGKLDETFTRNIEDNLIEECNQGIAEGRNFITVQKTIKGYDTDGHRHRDRGDI